MIEHVVFLLEEPSAQDFLERLIRIRDEVSAPTVHYIVFEGKQDLERQLARRLKGWLRSNTRFVVIRDQDSSDCYAIKARLQDLCEQAGVQDAIVRIVCRELESFYLGDWEAIADAYGKPALAAHGRQAKFRNPDHLGNPSIELKRIVPQFQKRDGARRISPRLVPGRNRSGSFRVICRTLEQLGLLPSAGSAR